MKQVGKGKLFIINRSFWPVYPVIGEALLRYAESQTVTQVVGVILQDHADIRKSLEALNRGQGVYFYPCPAISTSGSSILRRILDAVFFMFWVLGILLLQRPQKVYVSTDPPVIVPFVVFMYCKLFRAKYIYHLQDIHPEATNVVVKVKPFVFKLLQALDAVTMRHAYMLIALTAEMAEEIRNRSGSRAPMRIIPNPSIDFHDAQAGITKQAGFSFCGNAGRLQRIPLLIEAISNYAAQGGTLPFVFAGGGVYAQALEKLAQTCDLVAYVGQVSSSKAAEINARFTWALLPIEDEVTRYAFPSKSSSYVHSGAYIAAICGEQTSVSQWVSTNHLGLTIQPAVQPLVNFFFAVENSTINHQLLVQDRQKLKDDLCFDVFLQRLDSAILGKVVA